MSKPEYRHQCRYCAYCVFTIDDTWWCDELYKDIHRPKQPNKCKSFLFNEIAADFTDGSKVYKPRKPRRFKQMKLQFQPSGGKGAEEGDE